MFAAEICTLLLQKQLRILHEIHYMYPKLLVKSKTFTTGHSSKIYLVTRVWETESENMHVLRN